MKIGITYNPKDENFKKGSCGRVRLSYAPLMLLTVFMLTSCYAEHKNETAADKLKQWIGQNIKVAYDLLGPPGKTGVKGDKKAYFWHTERPENIRIIGGREIVLDGFIDQPTADHFNNEAPCDLMLVTRAADGTIIDFRMGGQIRACTQLSDKINAPSPAKE